MEHPVTQDLLALYIVCTSIKHCHKNIQNTPIQNVCMHTHTHTHTHSHTHTLTHTPTNQPTNKPKQNRQQQPLFMQKQTVKLIKQERRPPPLPSTPSLFCCITVHRILLCCDTLHCCVLGSSGRVVNSLDFYPSLLRSLGHSYFRCVLSSQWKAVTVNWQSLCCQL